MNRLLRLLIAGVVLSVTGCGTTTGLAPETSHSGFDNAQIVNVVPHSNIPNGSFDMITTGIGAQWNSANKDEVILVIAVFNDYTGISGAELNIDGEKIVLTPTPGVTDMTSEGGIKESTKGFVTSLQTVEKIVHSKRTWLRVRTPTGTMENAVIDGDKDSKAYNALIRFKEAIAKQQAL